MRVCACESESVCVRERMCVHVCERENKREIDSVCMCVFHIFLNPKLEKFVCRAALRYVSFGPTESRL